MTQHTEIRIPIGWNVVTELWDKFVKEDFIDTTLGPVGREYGSPDWDDLPDLEGDYDWYLDD